MWTPDQDRVWSGLASVEVCDLLTAVVVTVRDVLSVSSSGGLAMRAFGQCPVGWCVGVKSGPLGCIKNNCGITVKKNSC